MRLMIPGLERAARPLERSYLRMACCLLGALFVVLGIRLLKIQILEHPRYREWVERMLNGIDSSRGVRGDLVLRDGTLVARDFRRFTLAIDPGEISRAYQVKAVDFVCRYLGVSEAQRRRKHQRLEATRARPLRYLELAPRLPVDQARRVVADFFDSVEAECTQRDMTRERVLATMKTLRKGLFLEEVHHREYPRGAFCSHVVGTVYPGDRATDLKGLNGIERTMNSYLEGWDGHQKLICDGPRTTRIVSSANIDIPSIDGYNVELTIDSRIQAIVEEELENGVLKKEAAAGVAIVLDCRNGDVLALTSLPDFDPGQFHRYPREELEERRRNRAVESQYEPGSTIKPFIAAVALDEGLFRPDEIVWKGGRIARLLGRRVEDVSDHGPITLEEAVIYSSNIGMSLIGLRLAEPGLRDVLSRFRFQRLTHIPLPGEVSCNRRSSRKWTERYTSISVSFGYEVNVTPIQLVAAFCSVVNGGRYFRPRLINRVSRGEDMYWSPVERLGQPIDESTSRRMRAILHQVIERGTGRGSRIAGFRFGGKTGTAAISKGKKGYSDGDTTDYLSSFLAFAPYSEERLPEIVLLVMIEKPNPELGYYGSVVCGPVVKAILKRVYAQEEAINYQVSAVSPKEGDQARW